MVDDDDPLSPEERAYFTSRGQKPIPAQPSEPAAAAPSPAPEPDQPPAPAEQPPRGAGGTDTPPDEQPSVTPPRMVDARALDEERNRRKELEAKIQENAVLQARMEERFRMLEEQARPRQQPPRPPQPPPDPNQDIFGTTKYVLERTQEHENLINGYREREVQKEQLNNLLQWGRQQEERFRQQTPDYMDALNHVRELRKQELTLAGTAPEAIPHVMFREEVDIVAHAARSRMSPAEYIYNVAKVRGYKKAAPPPPPAATTMDQLRAIEAGQQASQSLSGIGGRAQPLEITPEALAKMSDDDVIEFKTKKPAQYRRLLGARN